MRRKRILMVNEASHTLSGFGTYGKEVLNRLVDSGKYDVAELAGFAVINDPRDNHVRWRYYPNAVDASDERFGMYQDKTTNQFGEWRFERVLLDFQPDVVFDIRDPWMLMWEATSPLRRFFNWAIMPTVDSAPQKEKWIDTFASADGVFTYSEWGLKVLEKQGQGRLKLQTTAPPGVDLQQYAPVEDKRAHRIELGLDPDCFILGTVMRNQRRKLYPDLFEAFRRFLDMAPKEVADKTYLYVHTSYPDHGWDIPGLLKEHNISNKVLFTYICRITDRPFISIFQDAKTYSPFSNGATGTLPSVVSGLTQDQMSQVYNLMDCYIQYAICEGFGMPQVEAAACGVPIMAVNYSAMEDIIERTDGIALKVQRMFREIETGADRAMPDNEYCAKMINKFFSFPEETRRKMGNKARAAAEQYYDWDKTATVWMDYFDSIYPTGQQSRWDSPYSCKANPNAKPPTGASNGEFVRWAFTELMGQPERANSLMALTIIKELNYGVRFANGKMRKTTQEDVYKIIRDMAINHVTCEQARCNMVNLDLPDYVRYAHLKEKIALAKGTK